MPYKDKVHQREYQRQWDAMKRLDPIWRKKRQKIKAKWRENNPDKVRAQRLRKYRRDIMKGGFRDKEKARNRDYRLCIRKEVLAHYSNGIPKCACCGEQTLLFLTVDHMNGGGREERQRLNRYGWRFYQWLRDEGFPAGYQVLCFNCNAAKGFWGECPHRRLEAIVQEPAKTVILKVDGGEISCQVNTDN